MRYEQHLGPLIKNGQAAIKIAPITDMAHLPEPGMLIEGNRLFEAGDLDAAEYAFKKLLHHVPGHITAQFMVGLIYARKGHLEEAITLVLRCVEKMPWKKPWINTLKELSRLLPLNPAAVAALTQAEALETKFAKAAVVEDADVPDLGGFVLDATRMVG